MLADIEGPHLDFWGAPTTFHTAQGLESPLLFKGGPRYQRLSTILLRYFFFNIKYIIFKIFLSA